MYHVQRFLTEHPQGLTDIRGDQRLVWLRSERRGELPPTIGEVVGQLGAEVEASRADYVPGRGWKSLLDPAARAACAGREQQEKHGEGEQEQQRVDEHSEHASDGDDQRRP